MAPVKAPLRLPGTCRSTTPCPPAKNRPPRLCRHPPSPPPPPPPPPPHPPPSVTLAATLKRRRSDRGARHRFDHEWLRTSIRRVACTAPRSLVTLREVVNVNPSRKPAAARHPKPLTDDSCAVKAVTRSGQRIWRPQSRGRSSSIIVWSEPCRKRIATSLQAANTHSAVI